MNDTTPTVTEVRTALIKETAGFYDRRRPYHHAMRNAPKGDPNYGALFDAYEGLVGAGCYAETLATVLRIVAERHPDTAADLASLIHDVMENGNDCLDGANDDVWPLAETPAAVAR